MENKKQQKERAGCCLVHSVPKTLGIVFYSHIAIGALFFMLFKILGNYRITDINLMIQD